MNAPEPGPSQSVASGRSREVISPAALSVRTGTCESEDGASWLRVTPVAASGDTRPLVMEIAGPTWGYHFQDINFNLVNDVHAAETAYNS
jgi:hypothetical protein